MQSSKWTRASGVEVAAREVNDVFRHGRRLQQPRQQEGLIGADLSHDGLDTQESPGFGVSYFWYRPRRSA
jgi:hypothetical protein